MSGFRAWAYNWEGRTCLFDNNTEFKIVEQLTEVEDPIMSTRHVLAYARLLPSNRSIMVKIRYEYAIFLFYTKPKSIEDVSN